MSGGGTKSTVTSTSSPPQVYPGSLEGFTEATDFYKNLLNNPPVYTGPTTAPPGSGQLGAIANTYDIYGGGITPWQQGALNTLGQGAAGALFQAPGAVGAPNVPGAIGAPSIPGAIGAPPLPSTPSLAGMPSAPGVSGPVGAPSLPGQLGAPTYNVNAPQIQMPSDPQAAVSSLAQPLMRQFRDEIIPGITARSLFAGQGPTSTREAVAQDRAIQNLGQSITDAAVAPIYTQGVNAAIAQAQLGERASEATAGTGANIYGTAAGQNVGMANAAANLFGTQAGQNVGLTNAAANIFGAQAQGAAAYNNALTNLYGQQAQAMTNLYGQQVGQNLGLGQLANSLFGQQVGQNLGLGQLATSIFGQQVGQNLGLGQLGLGAAGQQIGAATQIPGIDQDVMNSMNFLSQTGALENMLMQQPLTAAQQQAMAPFLMQSQAAQALINATLTGGGSVTGTNVGTQEAGTLGTIGQLLGMVGSIAGMVALCWVAEAIYGKDSEEFIAARHWIRDAWKGPLADKVRSTYLKIGPWLAGEVRKSAPLREALKPLFDLAVFKGREALTC
jgi:hypothetical protein